MPLFSTRIDRIEGAMRRAVLPDTHRQLFKMWIQAVSNSEQWHRSKDTTPIIRWAYINSLPLWQRPRAWWRTRRRPR